MNKEKNWIIKYSIPEIPEEFASSGISDLLSLILATRGYLDLKSISLLLNCSEDQIPDPRLILGMDKAVVRIKKAIQSGEKIAVYGDYDVDGITSTALLTDYLRSRGVNVIDRIPNRNDEGYGLNTDAIKSFYDDSVSLIITVDCGITSRKEAEYASSLGMDLIVTDHHECKASDLPECCAIIDCKQDGDSYPNPNLAGVGMAFKLVCAIDGNTHDMLRKYCDLVAIGTVADVMPLVGENRIFVKYGLNKIRENPRVGLKALYRDSTSGIERISASSISFYLAPRLNAAGRLDNAISAEKLLLTQDEIEANDIADYLSELNRQRQNIENEIWKEACTQLNDYKSGDPIVMSNSKWHPGVIGIAASRLAEHFCVPTIMIYTNGTTGKGSCRSYGGFNLFEALVNCSDYLVSYGGHALAAGLNIQTDKIEDFKVALSKYYHSNKSNYLSQDLECDLLITNPDLLSIENVKSLDVLEPYGNSNTKPLLCMSGVHLDSVTLIGNGKHSKFYVTLLDTKFECIFFSQKISEYGIKSGDYVDITFYPQVNEFRGSTNIQLVVQDIRIHDDHVICEDISSSMKYKNAIKQFKPSRNDFINIWKTNSEVITSRPKGMLNETFLLCKRVFNESGLINSDGVKIVNNNKVNLEETRTMKFLK